MRSVVKSPTQTGSDAPSSVSLKTRQAKVREWLKIAPLYRKTSVDEIFTTFENYRIKIQRYYTHHAVLVYKNDRVGYAISLVRNPHNDQDVKLLYKTAIDLLSEPTILAFEGRKAHGCITINKRKLLKTRKAGQE